MKWVICTVVSILACTVSTAQSETLVVNNAADDGSPHTLRWAILKNNAEGGGNRGAVDSHQPAAGNRGGGRQLGGTSGCVSGGAREPCVAADSGR